LSEESCGGVLEWARERGKEGSETARHREKVGQLIFFFSPPPVLSQLFFFPLRSFLIVRAHVVAVFWPLVHRNPSRIAFRTREKQLPTFKSFKVQVFSPYRFTSPSDVVRLHIPLHEDKSKAIILCTNQEIAQRNRLDSRASILSVVCDGSRTVPLNIARIVKNDTPFVYDNIVGRGQMVPKSRPGLIKANFLVYNMYLNPTFGYPVRRELNFHVAAKNGLPLELNTI